jgi:hypothetical protein
LLSNADPTEGCCDKRNAVHQVKAVIVVTRRPQPCTTSNNAITNNR